MLPRRPVEPHNDNCWHRLRQRCREQLRAEIAQTVARPEEIDDELRHLLDVFSG